jgi:Cu/Ag efflux protein CusF
MAVIMRRIVPTLFAVLAVLAGAALAGAHPAQAATSPRAIARIHGTIVRIDRVRRTFWIHHDPFAQMPMSMTMEVEPVRSGELARLHRGEVVDVTIDTTVVPWPGTNIVPARRGK